MPFTEGTASLSTDAPTQSLQKLVSSAHDYDANVVISAGAISLTTFTTGTNWTAFEATPAKQLSVVNASGTSLDVRRNEGAALTIPTGFGWQFRGITDASQISVRRTDQSNSPVTVVAEWEL